jgi:hypothetical protein
MGQGRVSTVFGYRTVTGIPLCSCRDPGDYVCMVTEGGVDTLRCWCGRSTEIKWDNPEERIEFIERNTRRQD